MMAKSQSRSAPRFAIATDIRVERFRESCAMRMHLKNSVIYYDLHIRFGVANDIDFQRQLEVPIYPYYQRSYTVTSHS